MLHRNFKVFPFLTTKRLRLRKLDADDAQAIFNLRSDSEVNRFLNRKLAHNLDEARKFINAVNGNIDTNSAIYWGITFRENNKLVGTICLYEFSGEDLKCEIGFELLTTFQGQGIMNEAVAEVIHFAFHSIGVQIIEAVFHKDNQRSIKLLERYSFKKSNEFDNANPDIICYNLERIQA